MAPGGRVCAVVSVVLLAFAAGPHAEGRHAGGTEAPWNIEAHGSVRKFIGEMLEKSPTLRRQCAEISAAPHVAVTLRITSRSAGFTRARTTMFKYTSGYLRAVVEIPVGTDLVELLAHELEHITEQIDGVDLAGLARTKSDVTYHEEGIYETTRAREAGEAAAREVDDARTRR
jgi:hypothetical protein